MKIQISPIGGLNEVGGNCTIYGSGNKFLCIDFGIKLNQVNSVSPFGTTLPSFKQIQKLNGIISKILITHAHEDHIGALRYLKKFIEKLPDKFDEQLTIVCNAFNKDVISKKIGKTFKFEVIDVDEWYPFIDGIEYKFIYINHSIPYSNAILIRTNNNIIMHTGDWRIDSHPILELNHFDNIVRSITTCKLNRHFTIVGDSTNAHVNKDSFSEKEIHEVLEEEILHNAKKLINTIICFFASNIVRCISCIKIARKHKLKAVILSPSVNMFIQLAIKYQLLNIEDLNSVIIPDSEVTKYNYGKVIIIASGAQGESNSSLMKLVTKTHKFIKINSKYCLLYSASPIPGNIDSVINMFSQLAIKSIDITTKANLHSSGHPYQRDLERLYTATKPNLLIPVHGTFYQMRCNGLLAKKHGGKFILLRNGNSIVLDGQKIELKPTLGDNKCTILSGELVDSQHNVFKDKIDLIHSGIMIVLIHMIKKTFSIDVIGNLINRKGISKINEEFTKILKENNDKNVIIKEINKCVRYSIKINILVKIYFVN